MRKLLDINICSKENVNRKVYYSNDRLYYIINYDKRMICYDDYTVGLYRSVIFSFLNKNVLSFSPPKSLANRYFIEKNPEINDTVIINEYIEGIMINLFYDKEIGKWDIATRDNVGGNYCVGGDRKKTVYSLFMEACRADITHDLNSLVIIGLLPREMSYTFIMKKGLFPQLYLVSVYIIYKNEVQYVSPTEYETWNVFSDVIFFPKRLNTIKDYDELYQYVNCIHNSVDDFPAGYMVHNTVTGEKTKFSTYVHYLYQKTKKAEPNLQYQYFCFRRICGGNSWLLEIPRNRKAFRKIHDAFEEFVLNVHISYMEKYIYKTLSKMPEKYEIHVRRIHHNLYLPSLNRGATKIKVTKDVVRNYFDKMEPRELLFIVNSDRRIYH